MPCHGALLPDSGETAGGQGESLGREMVTEMIQVERRLEDQEYLANHPEIETAISIIARVANSFPGIKLF